MELRVIGKHLIPHLPGLKWEKDHSLRYAQNMRKGHTMTALKFYKDDVEH
jgi:hypothetical protein